jgi:hypothetical protein
MTRLRGAVGVTVVAFALIVGAGCADRKPSRTAAPPVAAPAPLAPVPPNDAAAPADVDPAALTVAPMATEVKGARGQTVTATFRTRPGNSCQLEIRDAAGLTGERLAPTTADDQGLVSWSWTVADNAALGQAAAIVACSGGARGQATLVVS